MMTALPKPILYNGFDIGNGKFVEKRVAYEFFTDVYSLTDGRSLYVFTNLSPHTLIDSVDGLFSLVVGEKEYLSLIMNGYSKSFLSRMIDKMTVRNGFSAVAGMKELKMQLSQDIIEPLRDIEKYQRFKLSIPNGVLLFGPPGCGKTFIVRKLAEEIGYNFIETKHSDVASIYVHGSVNKIGRLFDIARAKTPVLIFIDEIEGLVPKRDGLGNEHEHKHEEINELLMQTNDAGKQKILVIAASNRPNLIDEALLRAGRMDRVIYVPPPDKEARIELFRLFLEDRPIRDINYSELADLTIDYASVDIEYISNEGARKTVISNQEAITQGIIEKVISETPSSITKEELLKYRNFIEKQRK